MVGISEERAAELAHVNRKTLRAYEDCPTNVKTPWRRVALATFYERLRDILAWSARVAREAHEDDDGPQMRLVG